MLPRAIFHVVSEQANPASKTLEIKYSYVLCLWVVHPLQKYYNVKLLKNLHSLPPRIRAGNGMAGFQRHWEMCDICGVPTTLGTLWCWKGIGKIPYKFFPWHEQRKVYVHGHCKATQHSGWGERGKAASRSAKAQCSPLPTIFRCVTLTSDVKQAALWRRNCYALNWRVNKQKVEWPT